MCGLSEGKFKYCKDRKHLVPPARVFTGFLNKLKKHKKEVEQIKEKLIKFMYENLEGFGEDCAIDGKYLDTYGNHIIKIKVKIIEENMKRQFHVKHTIWKMEV